MDKSNKLTVVKHNAIIDGAYRLNIYENRILLVCIGQIDSMADIGPDDKFIVRVQDLIDLVGVDSKSAYCNLEKAANRLYERSVIVDLPDNVVLKTRWISSIKYIKHAGMVELKFAQDMIPYISQLRRDFTKYRLNNVLMFKCNYSIRVYELIVRWSGNEKEIMIDELKKQFQLESKYTRIGDLKKKVLDPAVKEINQYSDMRFSYSQIKRGRNVIGFLFQYGLKNKPAKERKGFGKLNGIDRSEIDSKARPGESYQQAAKRLSLKQTKK